MSYCRCNGKDSDIYMYLGFDSTFAIIVSNYAQSPHNGKNFYVDTHQEAIALLKKLENSGCMVPKRAYNRLKKEIAERESEGRSDEQKDKNEAR